jgi:hypothetical protein
MIIALSGGGFRKRHNGATNVCVRSSDERSRGVRVVCWRGEVLDSSRLPAPQRDCKLERAYETMRE